MFEDRADLYDALIDWPKRLANEEPFFRDLFGRIAARRVLDAACGTGQHAALFHSWGLQVEGADASPAMIERSRQQYGESATLKWLVRSFEEPSATPGAFDAVVCIGNSLALASDRAAAGRAVAAMLTALRSGGVCVVQLLNLARLPDGPCVWQKFRKLEMEGRPLLLIKGVHRHGSNGFVEFLAVSLETSGPPPIREATRLLGLDKDDLSEFVRTAGARNVDFFGSYAREPYDRERSGDLIAVVEKA